MTASQNTLSDLVAWLRRDGIKGHWATNLRNAEKSRFPIPKEAQHRNIEFLVSVVLGDPDADATTIAEYILKQHGQVPGSVDLETLESLLLRDAEVSRSWTSSPAAAKPQTAPHDATTGATEPRGWFSAVELADELGVLPERRQAFLVQLGRKRRELGDCWKEDANRKPNSPTFIYRADNPILKAFAEPYRHPK